MTIAEHLAAQAIVDVADLERLTARVAAQNSLPVVIDHRGVPWILFWTEDLEALSRTSPTEPPTPSRGKSCWPSSAAMVCASRGTA